MACYRYPTCGLAPGRVRPEGKLMRRFVVLVGVVAVLAAGCSNDSPGPSADPAGTLPSSPGGISGAPGSYTFGNYGVVAVLEPDGDEWKLTVTNKTEAGIAKPGLYALDARDGHRIEGKVQGSVPIKAGESAEFAASFGADFDPKQVGLIILLVGTDNWGAFKHPS